MISKKKISFQSRGVTCNGWLYLPPDVQRPPIVVMAHGFAAEQSFRLPAFAEKFAETGMAVLTFDYRNFGESEGKPRNLVDPARHIEDWLFAINFAQTLREVDGKRIALWGSSFSGGHVLVVSAKHGGVSAVISQVPFVDGFAVAQNFKPLFALKVLAHGIVDGVLSLMGKVHYVKVIGEPDEFALMNTPECMQGYLALVPPDSTWENKAPARIALKLPFYRPISFASKIKCPVLMICAERDSLIPPSSVKKCASLISNCELNSFEVGHFDVYTGEMFEKVSKLEAEFLMRHLLRSAR